MQSTQENDRSYTAEMTLTDLVQRDHRLSSILDRYGLNYCCKGARTLSQACAENDLDTDEVLSELARVSEEQDSTSPAQCANVRDTLTLLYEEYEARLRAMLLSAEAKLQKVAGSHGDTFPQTIAAAEMMDELTDELVQHLARGKEVLSPRVNEILELSAQGQEQHAQSSALTLRHLLHELKTENRVMQRYLSEIRELTAHYKIPDGVCVTFSLSYRELAEFDQALWQFLSVEEQELIPRLFADPGNWR